MDEFDALQDDRGAGHRLEAEHQAGSTFDPPVVLLNAVVHLLALTDDDRPGSGSCPQPYLAMAAPGGFTLTGIGEIDTAKPAA